MALVKPVGQPVVMSMHSNRLGLTMADGPVDPALAAGTALVHSFSWIFWVFGAVLLLTGVKLLASGDEAPHPERNPFARLAMRLFPMTTDYRGSAFFVRESGRLMATPLFLALVAAEGTDIGFDVPAGSAVGASSSTTRCARRLVWNTSK